MPSSFNAASSSLKLNKGGYWIPSFPPSVFYCCQPMMFPHSGFNLPVMRRKTWRWYILHFFRHRLLGQSVNSIHRTPAYVHFFMPAHPTDDDCRRLHCDVQPPVVLSISCRGSAGLSCMSSSFARRNFGGPTADKHQQHRVAAFIKCTWQRTGPTWRHGSILRRGGGSPCSL